MANTTGVVRAGNLGSTSAAKSGRPAKRDDILRAAREVFGRDGYSRASIDGIATAAQVSTRTIYNHWESKDELFSTVLLASATQVADRFEADSAARPAEVTDVRAALIALARALAHQSIDFPEHFAMVRQINAERRFFPPAVLAAWQKAGPKRVDRILAERIGELGNLGLLSFTDRAIAARHLAALTAREVADLSSLGAVPLTKRRSDTIITAGVDAFLHGYAT